MKPKPAYYAVIPAEVRYNENLTSTAKLLFGEITALANTQGFCSASNAYFARLYSMSIGRISELVTSLVGEGYITIEVDREAGNKRKIRIGIRENTQTYTEKTAYPYTEKTADNNTSMNNSFNKERDAVYRLYLSLFKIDNFSGLTGDQKTKAMESAMKRYKLTPRRVAAIDRRLQDAGFKMLAAAVMGFGTSEWHTGKNDRGWVADLEAFICRSYENVEKGANLYEDRKKSRPDDDWAALRD